MKYFGRMITKLLVSNNFIEPEERLDVQKEFDEKFEKQQNSENKIIKGINAFFDHPIGVLISIMLWVFVNKSVRDSQRQDDDDEFNREFKNQMKAQIMDDMLNKND